MHKFPSEGLNLINTPTPNHFSLTFEFHKSLQQKDLITFRIVFICEDITFTIQKAALLCRYSPKNWDSKRHRPTHCVFESFEI